jgi:hypothetical protein
MVTTGYEDNFFLIPVCNSQNGCILYKINFMNNHVILCTDGDFNVGLSSDDALEKMIEEER